eukprot:10244041-Alexandrium_andersonii.AAC.1
MHKPRERRRVPAGPSTPQRTAWGAVWGMGHCKGCFMGRQMGRLLGCQMGRLLRRHRMQGA